ncbi:MAG: DUF4062 domain-containing protein [Halobacteriota archaeon]
MQQKVFISSRMKELSEERAAVGEAVSELGTHEKLLFTIWGWEDAKEIPSGKHPDEVQSKGVRDSDIYVLILGSEYGDFEYRESPTHKEYDIACSEREEDCILIYIKEVERRREENLEKWIKELKNKHTPKPFENRDQLKDLVKTRLRDLWNTGKWKVNIPTIQSTLRKEETTEGDFFKKEPEWIDFEEGFVVERKEVDEIIKKLENDNIQVVLGEPASGKSVILKNIGFKLAKENNVYVVEFKKHLRDEIKRYFDDIPEMKDEKAVFIVDDAHLIPADCERLVSELKNRKLKTRLIIGSRPTREIRGEHPKEASEFEYLSKTDIHAEDVTEAIIRGFLRREDHFSDERIKTVSENLEEYKKDLWHLSWALKAYNPEKDSVEEEEICEKIRDSIRKIKLGKDEFGKDKYLNAEDVFLPLSVFYRFEIPIEKRFLTKKLEIDECCIDDLIGISEIHEIEEIRKRTTLAMHHSSLASLYFEIYQRTDLFPDFGENIKERIAKQSKYDDLDRDLFYLYLTSKPTNLSEVLFRLNLKKVRLHVEDIAEASEEEALKLVDAVATRIVPGGSNVRTEITPDVIGTFLNFIASVSKRVAQEIFNRFNPELREAIGPISEVPGYRLVRRYLKE